MTPEIFAFVVMPGLVILTGLVGYAIIALTDPAKPGAASDLGGKLIVESAKSRPVGHA